MKQPARDTQMEEEEERRERIQADYNRPRFSPTLFPRQIEGKAREKRRKEER